MAATITLIGASSKEVIIDGVYNEPGATALQTDGVTDETAEIVITDDIDLGTAGAYTVTYTLPEAHTGEVAGDIVETRTVNIISNTLVSPMENVDTTFDLGDEDRTGINTSDTKYNVISDDQRARRDHNVIDSVSGLFDEGSLDPYEVKHSQA